MKGIEDEVDRGPSEPQGHRAAGPQDEIVLPEDLFSEDTLRELNVHWTGNVDL